jgi:hypothetical protein
MPCTPISAANRQEVIDMTRINTLRNFAGTRDSVAWGKRIEKIVRNRINIQNMAQNVISGAWGNINALVFAAVLIVCSVTVGCSSEQPKTVSSNNQIPITQLQSPVVPAPAPTVQAENKPAPKRVVHKKPATVNYTDKTYGVTFEYPRRYALETGDAAAELVLSNPVPMNFVQPGGIALAAVELPETGFANTDFSSAFFNVSVHKTLSADQCSEFAVPQPKSATTSVQSSENNASAAMTPVAANDGSSAQSGSTQTESAKTPAPEAQPTSTASSATPSSASATGTQEANATMAKSEATNQETNGPVASSASAPAQAATEPQGSKLLLGDMELRGIEAVSGEGTRQSDSKYFHVFQNGSCYEFALNVTTVASQDGLIKHVDRDKVFDRLQKILATVKINPVAAPEVTAETPATPAAAVTPAQ